MSLIIHSTRHLIDSIAHELASATSSDFCICTQSATDADRIRLELAKRDPRLSFGCTIGTFEALVQDAWELYGDSRHIATTWQAQVCLDRAFKAVSQSNSLTQGGLNPGKAAALHALIDDALCTPSVRELIFSEAFDPQLSPAECDMIELLRAYCCELDRSALCAQADAGYCMADKLAAGKQLIVVAKLVPAYDLVQCLRHTYNRVHKLVIEVPKYCELDHTTLWSNYCDQYGLAYECICDATPELPACAHELERLKAKLYESQASEPVLPQGDVCFALPAGRYAQHALYAQLVSQAVSQGKRVRLVHDDVRAASRSLSRLFPHIGQSISMSYKLSDSAFYQACKKLIYLGLEETNLSAAELMDYVVSPLFEQGIDQAQVLIDTWLCDRTVDATTIADVLHDGSTQKTAQLIDAFKQGNYAEAFSLLRTRLDTSYDLPALVQAEYRQVLSYLERSFSALEACDVSPLDYLSYIEAASLRIAAANSEDPQVELVSLACASEQLEPVDVLILTDLNASHIAAARSVVGHAALFEKYGTRFVDDPVLEWRSRFARLVHSAKNQIYFARCLHTTDADPENPAFLFDDITDCYRQNFLNRDELDKATLLPQCLLSYLIQKSESDYADNFASATPKLRIQVPTHTDWERRDIQPQLTSLVNPQRRYKDMQGKQAYVGHKYSASMIDVYLNCPLRWFYERRCRLSCPGEDFSVRESGTFAHHVMCLYYRTWREQFGSKANTSAQLEQECKLVQSIFDEELEKQKDLPPGERYLPVTEIEMQSANTLRQQLVDIVVHDAKTLRAYTPRYFEYEFGQEDLCFYAGLPIRGSIDRIDVRYDPATGDPIDAIVIDYKSAAALRGMSLAQTKGRKLAIPEKPQALIYASVVQELLGIPVVGAFYYSLKDCYLGGLYSDYVLSPSDLDHSSAKKQGISTVSPLTFADFLQQTEAAIAQELEKLEHGHIEACGDKSCPVCSRYGKLRS